MEGEELMPRWQARTTAAHPAAAPRYPAKRSPGMYVFMLPVQYGQRFAGSAPGAFQEGIVVLQERATARAHRMPRQSRGELVRGWECRRLAA